MTAKTITLSFTNENKNLCLVAAKLGDRPISATAATAGMKTLLAKLKNYDAKPYQLASGCKNFTATLELPPNETRFNLQIADNARTWIIKIPLKQETAETFGPELLDQLLPVKSSSFSLKNLLALFMGLFSFLWTKVHSEQAISGIRGLSNPGNDCFINSIFQALMNAPEIQSALIDAHQQKINDQQGKIDELQASIDEAVNHHQSVKKQIKQCAQGKWWSHYYFDKSDRELNNQFRSQTATIQSLVNSKQVLLASMTASLALIEAIESYEGARSISLNDLRGLLSIGSLKTNRQEDACELLDKIFEPLSSTTNQLFHRWGEEKQLIPYIAVTPAEIEKRKIELEKKKDVSEIHKNGLVKKTDPRTVLQLELSGEKVSLQDMLTQRFSMHPVQDEPVTYQMGGQKGWYTVSKAREVIESIGESAPEYVVIQLKRFKMDEDGVSTKIHTDVGLPPDNKLTLRINENGVTKDVAYDIQTLVLHAGNTSDSGHYFDYVKKADGWHEANDSRISPPMTLPPRTEKLVYLLFLKKSV